MGNRSSRSQGRNPSQTCVGSRRRREAKGGGSRGSAEASRSPPPHAVGLADTLTGDTRARPPDVDTDKTPEGRPTPGVPDASIHVLRLPPQSDRVTGVSADLSPSDLLGDDGGSPRQT